MYIVYSPKVNNVWYLPMGKNRIMKICSNGHYADDDFLCWPQMYNKKQPHLPFIPRRPSASHPLEIMWKTPSLNNHVVSEPDVLKGVGLLDCYWIGTLRSAVDTLKACHKEHEHSMQGRSVTPLVVDLEDALTHLELLPGTFSQVQFVLAHLQRFFLKLMAWLDYTFVYYPMMIGTACLSLFVQYIVRTFIKPGPAVQQHLHAGAPLWIVQPSQKLPLI